MQVRAPFGVAQGWLRPYADRAILRACCVALLAETLATKYGTALSGTEGHGGFLAALHTHGVGFHFGATLA